MEKKFQFFRKLLLLTLLTLGVGSAFGAWDGTSMTEPSTEKIDGKDYYIIDSEAKLAWFAKQVNSGKKSYNAKLTANLDMGGQLWTPIGAGNNKNNYNGTFDGNKHVISNLYIAAEELIEKYNDNDMAQNIGFIGCFSGTVKNLILENIEVHGYGKGGIGNPSNLVDKPISIGTVVGWQSTNASVIDGCYATGVVITSGDGQAVGGIVGNVGGGTVSNCYSAVDIYASGLAYVGGIAGYTKNFKVNGVNGTVTVESCIYAGNTLSTEGSATVNGNEVSGAAGAIIGYQYKGNVTLSNLYYDEEQFPGENAGIGATTDGSTTGTTTAQSNVNSAETICLLNKGVYNENDGSCSKDSPWEMGESGPALIEYSSDGYKITFDANNGFFAGNANSAVKYVKLDYVINDDGLVKPSRNDFAFIGWSANKNATEPDQNLGTASGAATFYAVWNPIYTITFSAAPRTFPVENGQTPETQKTVKVEKGKKIAVYGFDVPEPYHDNEGKKHSFMGWAEKEYPTEEDALIDENGLDNLPIATKNTTLYAVWVEATVFTVIFDANGHGTTVSRYQKTVYDQDQVAPLAEENMPHEEGYVLNSEHGWCVKPECGENDFFDFSTLISENITLYAHWDAIEYDISYENLNGANNTNPAKYTAAGLTLENLVSVDGAQKFKGWCVDEELKNCISSIPAGSTGDITLFAKWEDVTYPIIYRAAGSGATGNVSQGVKKHGEPYTLLGESYNRPGYKQNGWTTSLDGEKIYDFGDTYTGNASVTFYPTWEIAQYVVMYECNGCENNPLNPTTYTMFENKDLPLKYPQNLEGYDFGGWFKEDTYETKTTQIKMGSWGDLTLYGKWLKVYTITYVGTDNSYGDKTYTSEKAAQLRGCAPREGYTFAGWYDNAEFAGEPVTEIPLGSTGDKTFYAKWNKVYPFVAHYGAITITEENENSAVVAEIDGTSEETVNIPAADNVSVNQVVFNRDFSGGVRSTVMFPFTVSLDDVEGGEFWEFTAMEYDSETKKWTFRVNEPVDNELKANKPYIFIAEDKNITFKLSGAVSLSTENMNPSVHDGWVFKGSYEQITFNNTHPDWTYGYGYSDDNKKKVTKGKFVRFKTSGFDKVNLTPMRAYLVYQPSLNKSANIDNEVGELPEFVDVEIVGKKGFVIGGGIFNTKTGEFKMDRWYDLSGRRLNGKPTTQGTYYYNGKRVIIR